MQPKARTLFWQQFNMSTHCSLLWTHAAINVDGAVMPCCRFNNLDYKLPHISDGLSNALNGEVFADIRKRMLAGEKLDNCAKCWQQEEATGNSMRTFYNEKYPIITFKPKYIEIGFSTHCNLACRMCDETYSSKWWTINNPGESVDIGYNIDNDWIDVDLSEVVEVKIVGGEPMMATQHDGFLEKLLKNRKHKNEIQLIYFTNATKRPSERVINYWRGLKEIVLNLSIDGFDEVNTYQRPGSDWAIIEDTITYYKQLAKEINIKIYTHTVVTALNIWYMHKFYEWHDKTFTDGYSGIDVTESPDYLSLRNMPDNLKQKAVKYCNENIQNEEHKLRLINKIQQEPRDGKQTTLKEIKQNNEKLDSYFGQTSLL